MPHESSRDPLFDRRAEVARQTRFRRLAPVLIGWLLAVPVLGAVSLQRAAPAEWLVLDPASAPGGRWYYGLVTSLGVLAWTLALGACAVVAFAASRAGRRKATRAFGWGAALVGLLLADDLFLIHSWLPVVTPIPAAALPLIEVALIGCWVRSARSEIARTRWELLTASGFAFGISTLLDLLDRPLYAGMWTVAEEGAKFLALVALALWASRALLDIVGSMVRVATGSGLGADAPTSDLAVVRR